MADVTLLCLALASAIFATMWLVAMTRRHATADRHLAAIRFATTFSYAAAGGAIRLLRLYHDGRHDLIAIQFPGFAGNRRDGEEDP